MKGRATVKNQNNEYWHVSPLNFESEIVEGYKFPDKVFLHDVTLRDGEQTPGVVFDHDSRIEIAKMLSELGVHRIEVGFPAVSEEDNRAIADVAKLGLKSEIWGFGRCLPQDVELNAKCGLRNVTLEISISEWKLNAYGLSRDKVVKRMIEAITLAKDLDMKVAFMPVDLTRADINFAQEIISLAATKAYADEIVIVDSIGVATPEAISYLTRKVREWVKVPLSIHCHNDFGLGLSNSIAGLKEGVSCVHASINCLGERAGNVDLAEVAIALKMLYGVEVGLRTELLANAATVVETLSGQSNSLTKPIVGKNIFARESGAVVQQILASPASVEPYTPELVGLERRIVLGKMSGKYSILHKLDCLGVNLPENLVGVLLEKVKQKSTKEHPLITDQEFLQLIDEVNRLGLTQVKRE